tara:strand:- start:1544 stop:1723 length:180 start_codon:yes stop_codon:yes gene_type:complete
MQYKNVPFDDLENIQPNAILKLNPNDPNEIFWINLDVNSTEKRQYLEWLDEGNTPLPAN